MTTPKADGEVTAFLGMARKLRYAQADREKIAHLYREGLEEYRWMIVGEDDESRHDTAIYATESFVHSLRDRIRGTGRDSQPIERVGNIVREVAICCWRVLAAYHKLALQQLVRVLRAAAATDDRVTRPPELFLG